MIRPIFIIGWIGVGVAAVVILILVTSVFFPQNHSHALIAHASPSKPPVKAVLGIKSPPTVLTPAQKIQIVNLLTENANQLTEMWQEGQRSLDSFQYADPYQEMAALSQKNSAAEKLSTFKNTFNANNNYVTVLNTAEKIYPKGVSDEALRTWATDMGHLVNDIETWITDAQSWQIKESSQSTLMTDVNTITIDFTRIQNDVKVIGQ